DPTTTFHDRPTQRIGDLTVEYRAMKGETDDDCTLWIPEHRMLFVGDKATWKVPNSGNPLKVQRYPVEWVTGLEEMAGYGAEWLCPGHDLVLRGADLVRTFLLDQARYLRSIIDQVLARMNAGQAYDEILRAVAPDPELAGLPHIRTAYNHPKFIVRDLLRYWGGWWDGEGSTLLPAPRSDQAAEIIRLAGGPEPVLTRTRELAEAGNLALACHLVDWATKADPQYLPAQELKRHVYRERADREEHGMAAGFFLSEAADADREIECLTRQSDE
ncbi:alkyl sulfatase dimerization domain-containing protein, partial [Candidatus Bipolaricaulota bacterium]